MPTTKSKESTSLSEDCSMAKKEKNSDHKSSTSILYTHSYSICVHNCHNPFFSDEILNILPKRKTFTKCIRGISILILLTWAYDDQFNDSVRSACVSFWLDKNSWSIFQWFNWYSTETGSTSAESKIRLLVNKQNKWKTRITNKFIQIANTYLNSQQQHLFWSYNFFNPLSPRSNL